MRCLNLSFDALELFEGSNESFASQLNDGKGIRSCGLKEFSFSIEFVIFQR